MHIKGIRPEAFLVRNYLFLKNYVNSEGAVSTCCIACQQSSIARYQVSFYANDDFCPVPLKMRNIQSVVILFWSSFCLAFDSGFLPVLGYDRFHTSSDRTSQVGISFTQSIALPGKI